MTAPANAQQFIDKKQHVHYRRRMMAIAAKGMDMQEKLLSRPEAAKLLGISDRTLFSLTKIGYIRSVKIGAIVRYDPADIRAFIDGNKTGGVRSDNR